MKNYAKELSKKQSEERIGEEKYNYQGCLMKIVEYNRYSDITVEFQDDYKALVNSEYKEFLIGQIKNPYYPSVFKVGMIGVKYPSRINGKNTKEYNAWNHMLERCFDIKFKEQNKTYKDVTCCKDWLLFENFYEWLHKQDNFDKWYNGNLWAVDKDILVKGNKIYSPETCCLVPQNVNSLLTKRRARKNNFPIGVEKHGSGYRAICQNPFINKQKYSAIYGTPEDAFYLGYKPHKESIIKQVAKLEYAKGNITENCRNAMMRYEVEITD